MTTVTLKKNFASLPRTTRGQAIVINGDPKGKNFLYSNGNQIFIRNIEDPSICDVYSEHVKDTTVAKYAPSGFYIASGDVTGNVRIWDTVNPEHILKNQFPMLGGAIKDIDWSDDSKRICVVGEGRETFAKVFSWDTGTSVGELSGHSKTVNSVSMKPQRPYKVVTGSEDFTAIFYEGPPFKFVCTKRESSNFVNCVRYMPSGAFFAVGGADGQLRLYDGKTSELVGEFGAPKAHKGGIYGFCFSPDSKKLLSVSGDKTAKVWDVDSKSCETEFVMGKEIVDMQLGCLWEGDHLMTVSLSGHINYLDQSNPSQHKRIIKGHNKAITALAVTPDGSSIYSASFDGLMVKWDFASGNAENFKGKGHTNQVSEAVLDGDYLVSIGMDDTIRFTKAASEEYGESIKLDSQPRGMDSKNGVTVVIFTNEIVVFASPGKKLSTLSTKGKFEASSVSVSPNGTDVVVGSNSAFYLYNISNGVLSEVKKFPVTGTVNALAYSPDGSVLGAACDKFVELHNTSTWEDLTGNWSSHHTAKVTCLDWSPDSRRLASGSVDSNCAIWEAKNCSGNKPSVKAHPMSIVNKVRWLNNHTLVTAGQDANLKIWDVSE